MTRLRQKKERTASPTDEKRSGLRPVLLRLAPATVALMEQAAKLDGRTPAEFLEFYGVEAARRIIACAAGNDRKS